MLGENIHNIVITSWLHFHNVEDVLGQHLCFKTAWQLHIRRWYQIKRGKPVPYSYWILFQRDDKFVKASQEALVLG